MDTSLLEKTLQDRVVGSNPNLTSKNIKHIILNNPLRFYFITKVKDPIRKALEAGKTLKEVIATVIESAKRIPNISNEDIDHPTSRLLAEKLDEIVKYHKNSMRSEMVKQACKLLKAEHAHDDYYAWFFDYLIVELAFEVLRGTYKPKRRKFPLSHCWKGPEIPDHKFILNKAREILTGYEAPC